MTSPKADRLASQCKDKPTIGKSAAILAAMTSLSRRFNSVFMLLVAVPVILVCLLLSWLYLNALLDVVTKQTEETSTQVAQNMGNEIDQVSIFTAALLYDRELRNSTVQYMTDKNADPAHTALAQMITEKLSNALTYTNRIGAIVLYMKDGTVLSFNNYPNIRSFSRPDSPAYVLAKSNPGSVVVADSLSGVNGNIGERFLISAMICPPAIEEPTGVNAMLVMFRIPYLDQLSSIDAAQSGHGILIYGRDGTVLLSNLADNRQISATLSLRGTDTIARDFRIGNKSWLVISRSVGSADWTVVSLVDKSAITAHITAYQWYVYPALLIMLGMFVAYAVTFFSRIARPIHSLSATMTLVGQGHNKVSLNETGIAELDQLMRSFNSMVGEIQILNQERAQREEKRLAAEIAALQFQINPHFMANTLNSIRFMAIASKNEAIREMTQALIRIVADSYATSDPMTRLDAEIGNVSSYVYIMKVRFGEHINVAYDIAPETGGLGVLRMMLQPMVENAILHGFAELDRQGLVRIASHLDENGNLEITVSDNGKGMGPERIAEVLEGDKSIDGAGRHFNRIGIHNVQERIRLNFGDEYGLNIQSTIDEGTTIRFILPSVDVSEPSKEAADA